VAPAAGWVKKFVDKGKDGIWAISEWTERAKTFLVNKEYRYHSPVIWVRAADRKVVAVLNMALTNFPKINNLKPIIAKMEQDLLYRKEENNMLEKLKKLLGLAADAGEEKIEEAVTLLINKTKIEIVACKEVLEAIGAKAEAKKDEVIQIIGSLKVPADVAKTLSHEVADLRKELSEIKQNDLVQIALKEGKTSPDELDKWGRDLALKNPEQFKLIVLSRPSGSVIPIGAVPAGPKDKDVAMDEVQRQINKMMGVSDETFRKYNPVKQ
jgi:phage I-like protein